MGNLSLGVMGKRLLVGTVAICAASASWAADIGGPPPIIEHQPVSVAVGGNWYLRGDVGVSIVEGGKFRQADVTAANGTFLTTNYGDAPFVGIGAGYRFNEWFRADVTAQFRGSISVAAIDEYTFVGGAGPIRRNNFWSGGLWSAVTMVNAYADFGNFWGITPYVGIGVGGAYNKVHGLRDWDVFGLGGSGYAGSKGTWNFAWALHGGLGYEVNEALTLEAGYSYTHLGDAASGRLRCLPTPNVCNLGPVRIKDLHSHDLRLGMRWNFNPEPIVAEPIVRKF